MLTALATGGSALVAVGSALIGLGVGASVSPALFMTGFTLRSAQIQRVFALIELLRGVTAFLVAPLLLTLVLSTGKVAGIQAATWICLAIAGGGGVAALAVFFLGRGRLQRPDLNGWTSGEPAWDSPPLLARLRRGPDRTAAVADEPAEAPASSDDRAA